MTEWALFVTVVYTVTVAAMSKTTWSHAESGILPRTGFHVSAGVFDAGGDEASSDEADACSTRDHASRSGTRLLQVGTAKRGIIHGTAASTKDVVWAEAVAESPTSPEVLPVVAESATPAIKHIKGSSGALVRQLVSLVSVWDTSPSSKPIRVRMPSLPSWDAEVWFGACFVIAMVAGGLLAFQWRSYRFGDTQADVSTSRSSSTSSSGVTSYRRKAEVPSVKAATITSQNAPPGAAASGSNGQDGGDQESAA
eukprot:TRINITY_DN44207_c0_g1_i1.p1 TRINITY_DN44207_c0_g1~~TRINITY_DN44207_c0_g1_i1.p1  ORF type:complete len:253 (-),score=44.56 TRINITY_DN44207_c0_g1_i1:49-807(-)